MVLNQIFVKMPRLGILAKGAYKFVIPSVTYLPAQNRLCVTKYGVNCFFDRVQLVDVTIAHSPCVLLWASAPSFPSIFLGVVSLSNHAPRDSRSDPPGRRSHEPSGSQIYRGRTPAFMRRRPRWVARCSVHVALSKSPQPTPDAKGAGVPERKFGSEALEASAKLRKSSIGCLSAASFEAARSEQLRLPAEGPLKRRDASSRKSMLNPLPGLGFSTHGTRLFVKGPSSR